MKKWLVLLFSLIYSCAFTCEWEWVDGHAHYMKEVECVEYNNKCIHINYNDDWGKNNYSIMFFYRGRPTGVIYYERTSKDLKYILNFLNVYKKNDMSFSEIIRKELGDAVEIEKSNLTGQKMSISFGNVVQIFD